MTPVQLANPEPATAIRVDGHLVVLSLLQEGDTPEDPRMLTVSSFLNRPLPSSLMTVGTPVQVELSDERAPFRVTSVQEHEGWDSTDEPPTYSATLKEILPRLAPEGTEDEIEVLYRTALSASIARTQIRALGQLLESKGLITAGEYHTQMTDALNDSFLHFAREIVAQQEAEQMHEAVLFDLPDRVDSTTGHEFPFVGIDVGIDDEDDLNSTASKESN